jgi:ADP-ribose pyrophosphatase YjhB (NUDIX family)
MMTPYDFQNIVAIKILVKRNDTILLIREPEYNDWMPNRLGLPGGKPLLNESLSETITRKVKSDIGFEIDVKGIVKIENILMPEKTVYHLILAADYVSGEINTDNTESKDINWYTLQQITKLEKDDFTEYYNDNIIKSYLKNELTLIPMAIIEEQDNRTDEIMQWMQKGHSS